MPEALRQVSLARFIRLLAAPQVDLPILHSAAACRTKLAAADVLRSIDLAGVGSQAKQCCKAMSLSLSMIAVPMPKLQCCQLLMQHDA